MHLQPTSPPGAIADSRALGRAVRELRLRRTVTQERLGDDVGTHRNYVGAIERGEVNPTFRTLAALAGGLGVPLSELMLRYERQLARASAAPRHGAGPGPASRRDGEG